MKIRVRKGERDAKVQKTAQHLLGPEITGAACPVSAPRRVRYCEYWSLLVRAWMTSRGSPPTELLRSRGSLPPWLDFTEGCLHEVVRLENCGGS
ncbi:hypothetical protein GEV33_003599 [Tenebrio molitor]|uniref:Uncharacterized protein n=1 Tax=Tenebrio molitor TaxID=7067 RepID=A0A8J6HRV2_TENMO|nr:hypothetical protein GEV33_003599 [Tenebrio molitor]